MTTNGLPAAAAAEVFDLFAEADCHGDLIWRPLDENGLRRIAVMCSDVFWWGTADAEPITEDDIADLKQARADCIAVGVEYDFATLWVARKRGMRPQGAMYPHLDKPAWPLFDACGPEREPDLTNPHRQPEEPQ